MYPYVSAVMYSILVLIGLVPVRVYDTEMSDQSDFIFINAAKSALTLRSHPEFIRWYRIS